MDTFVMLFLGLVGLGLAASSIVLTRDYGRRGLLALMSGAGILAAMFFWLQPILSGRGDDGEVRRLVGELARSTKRAEVAEQATASVTERLDQTAKALEAARKAKTDSDVALDESLVVIRQEIGELQQHYAGAGSEIYLDEPTATGAADEVHVEKTPAERLDRIRRDLAAMRKLKSRTPAASGTGDQVARVEETRELMRLKDKMSTKLETPHYDVEVYPQKELVGGRQGRYYVVDFKDASSGIRYYFEGGKYSISRANAEFRSSLNAFIGDVLKKIDGKVRYDLFVRGSADAKAYQGRFEPGLEYREIPVLKNAGDDKYVAQPVAHRLDGTVRNGDLPNLRAAFMRDVVAENYPVKPPVILEGAVSPKANDRDRNVELILFIDW
ncbi:MAG: hypothetical protein ACT4N2_10445 [Hyphomicrobium sp.]